MGAFSTAIFLPIYPVIALAVLVDHTLFSIKLAWHRTIDHKLDAPINLARNILNNDQELAEIILAGVFLVFGLTFSSIPAYAPLSSGFWSPAMVFTGSVHYGSMLWFSRSTRFYCSILLAAMYCAWWMALVRSGVDSPASILLFTLLSLAAVCVPRTLHNGRHQ